MTYDEDNLKPQPSTVHNQPLPLNMLQPNRIKYRRRENRCPAKELEDCNSLRALRERKQFHQKSCDAVSNLSAVEHYHDDSL